MLREFTLQDVAHVNRPGFLWRSDRCSAHNERVIRPVACHICTRIAIEREVTMRAVEALTAAEYLVSVYDGEEYPLTRSSCVPALMRSVGTVDDEYLEVWTRGTGPHNPPRSKGWIRLVYGNDGYDVISDYTVNLESVLEPVNAYADTLA
jgi:hypothetical protein